MKRITRRSIAWMGTTIVLGLVLTLASQGVAAQREAQQEEPAAAEGSSMLAPSSTLISYQGTLTDQNGSPVNATVTMVFALYDASNGGNLKWGTETQSVQVTSGLFNVLLGSVAPIDPANLTGDLWLDIKVNGEQLTPRERLTTVAYAAEAGTLPAGAQTRGSLRVNGFLTVDSPDSEIYGLQLRRTDEDNRIHKWMVWHMNQPYTQNSLQIWEYRTDRNGTDCGGDPADGPMCNPRFTIVQGGNVGIGTTNPAAKLEIVAPEGHALIASGPVSLWGAVGMHDNLWLDGNLSTGGSGSFGADVNMNGHSIINCGALTEANLQTPEESAAGRSDRFEEGDVLCWGIDRLEKCSAANDRLVQAVADKSGRPIVIGAEAVKVLGPVKRGDILVASEVPGYAMVNNDPVSGSVIAQALEDFEGERGIIKAMIRKW